MLSLRKGRHFAADDKPKPPLPAGLTVGGLSDARRVRADGVDPKTLSACENADETNPRARRREEGVATAGIRWTVPCEYCPHSHLHSHLLSRAA